MSDTFHLDTEALHESLLGKWVESGNAEWQIEREGLLVDGVQLYWSTAAGWVPRDAATSFAEAEMAAANLPGQGSWVLFKDGDDVTWEDVGDEENIHSAVDELMTELEDDGILTNADGWSICIYPLHEELSWSYLMTVRPRNGRGPFVQVAGVSEDVRMSDDIAGTVEAIVATANEMLPAARAALAALTAG